jgi:predicted xylose isomerase-like sugar epimerase
VFNPATSPAVIDFSRVSQQFHHHLDGLRPTNHCAAMNGLNHICGICPEIIR